MIPVLFPLDYILFAAMVILGLFMAVVLVLELIDGPHTDED